MQLSNIIVPDVVDVHVSFKVNRCLQALLVVFFFIYQPTNQNMSYIIYSYTVCKNRRTHVSVETLT